jgi:hypothetical protein
LIEDGSNPRCGLVPGTEGYSSSGIARL